MRNPIPVARRAMRWAAWWLRWVIECLRRREGSLSFHAEQRGPFARQAEALSGVLGSILTDQLGPAADALEREGRNEGLLPEPEDPDDEESEEDEPEGSRP